MPLPEHLQRLLAECEVEAYRSSGPGGQKKNKTESSVRVRHLPTGVVRISTESRSQMRNREAALQRVFDTLEARKKKPKPRVATKPSRAAKERRIESKRRTSEVKRQRSRRADPD
ncbi:MAG: peptide chain release factor-like protein [Candidatus Eisenbacteria bacterium]|nr:peptide chain release factor-like protein [Candidatus Eisenbacteria bacterium]